MPQYLENNPATPNVLAAELERIIDEFVNRLKQQLVQTWTNPQSQRGVLDRMKGWWSNMWHGRYNQNNPYFWKNKLGDELGRTESVMPLEHYNVLSQYATLLEESLPPGTERLKLIQVIDNWGRELKSALMKLVQNVPHEPLPSDQPAEPTPTPAEENPLENWTAISTERLEQLKDKISQERYELVKYAIQRGEQEQVDQFLDFFEKHAGNESPPPRTAKMKTPGEQQKTQEDLGGPKSVEGKKWTELTPYEQLEWDNWGGGNAGDATVLTKKNGVDSIPWILRIGDPRLKEIQLYSRALYKRLVRQKRIESASHPIKSEEELKQAIAVAAKLRNEEREKHSQRNKATAQRIKLQKEIEAQSKAPEVETPPEPVKPNTAPMVEPQKEDPTVPVKTPRTAKMKLPREPKVKTKTESGNTEKLTEFRSRIENLKDKNPETFQRLQRMLGHLEQNATEEQLARMEKHIQKAEKVEEEDDDAIDGDSGIKHFENTRFARTKSIIENFRFLARR